MGLRRLLARFFLPPPLDGVDFKTSGVSGFPGQHLAAIGKIGEVLLFKDYRPIAVSLKKYRSLAAPFFGEDDRKPEASGLVADLGLPPFLALGKAVPHLALDVELLNVAAAFALPQ